MLKFIDLKNKTQPKFCITKRLRHGETVLLKLYLGEYCWHTVFEFLRSYYEYDEIYDYRQNKFEFDIQELVHIIAPDWTFLEQGESLSNEDILMLHSLGVSEWNGKVLYDVQQIDSYRQTYEKELDEFSSLIALSEDIGNYGDDVPFGKSLSTEEWSQYIIDFMNSDKNIDNIF